MHIKNKKRGQSTVEYVLLLTAVVVVIIAFVSSNRTGGFQAQLNTTLNEVSQDMNSEGYQLSGSHAATSAPTGSSVGVPVGYTVNVN